MKRYAEKISRASKKNKSSASNSPVATKYRDNSYYQESSKSRTPLHPIERNIEKKPELAIGETRVKSQGKSKEEEED